MTKPTEDRLPEDFMQVKHATKFTTAKENQTLGSIFFKVIIVITIPLARFRIRLKRTC